MKLATYWYDGYRHAGLVSPDNAVVTHLEAGSRVHEEGLLPVIEMMANGLSLSDISGKTIALSSVRLDAPLPRPRRNIFCVGKNYHAHAREFARSGFDTSLTKPGDDIPEHPIIFSKLPETVTGPDMAIRMPAGISEAVDYEAELAVVIGKGGKGISRSKAMEHVWGYTIINDVTARDWQQRHKQWLLGKSFDTFCPMGPWIVSADACNGLDAQIRCWVNNELRQDARTSSLIFDIPKLIETISAGITLYPGDLIATGTPEGVGIGLNPPKYLKAGDRVRIEIEGLGILENSVVA